MKPKPTLFSLALLVLSASIHPLSHAAPVQFTIDPDRSHATLSGVAAGLTVVEQGPGSLTTSFAGQVLADLDPTAIHFVAGSLIDALPNGDWSPKPFGESGTDPADFGAAAGGGFLSGTAALRDVILDLASETPIPIEGGEFNADGLLFVFPEETPSAFDFRINALGFIQNDREPLAGYATNRIATVASLTTEGLTETLTIPVEATIVFELLNPNDSTLTIEGQLVATRALDLVPALRIASARLHQGELVFEWNAEAGVTFEVERTTDLSQWTKVAEVPGELARWQIPVTETIGFFRVVKP